MTSTNRTHSTEQRHHRAQRAVELMAQVAQGDQDAFADLYDVVAPVVHGTTLRVLRDPDHAAEVTQEVLVEIWRNARRFSAKAGSVSAWVATMAHRRAVDRVRAVQSQRERDERALAENYERPRDTVSDEVEQRHDRHRVLSCLETLTAMQRDAVVATYYDGDTYREAAIRSDVALPTMKSRIRDGLTRLRQCLEANQ